VETGADLRTRLLESDSYKRLKKSFSDHNLSIGVIAVSGGIITLGVFGSALVANAVILAITSTTGFVFLASKLPRSVQKTLVRYGLLTDILAATATYILFGSTVTALLAASLVGIMTSVIIWTATPYLLEDNHTQSVRIQIEVL